MHPSYQAQIALLKADETLIAILSEYADFEDVVSLDLIVEFLKYIEINNYVINLINGK